MSVVSSILFASLVGFSAAFPGLRSRGDFDLSSAKAEARSASYTSTSSAAGSSHTWPAWHPAGPGEVRGPCPALNSLANHDICPRSGKGWTIPILTKCLAKGLNVGADISLIVGTVALGSNPDPLLLSFDLDMLDRHDTFIEHDASLSRADASTGDNHSFNQTIWDTMLTYFNSSTHITIPIAAAARFNRVQVEKERDPGFTFGPTQWFFQAAETALYLSAMGDPITGVAPVKYVRTMFEEEKLPYELGWTPPTLPTTFASVFAMTLELIASTGEIVPDGITLTEYSVAATLLGLDGLTGDVANSAVHAVAGLTGALEKLTGL